MKILRYLSFVVLSLFSLNSFSQIREFDLGKDYGLTPADKSKHVSDVFTTGQDTVKLKWAWAAKKAQGVTYTQFRQLYIAAAYLLDATWASEAPNNIGKFQNAFNYVKAPAGGWNINTTCPLPRGGMEGKSSFPYYGENSVTTEFIMEDNNWIGAGERILFSTPNWQNTSNSGYNESFKVENLCLSGPGKRGDGITRIGLALGKAGECTQVNQVRSDRFNYGFVASGGVPLTIGTITAFHNDLGGFVGLGCAQSTIAIGTLSGDSNGELFGLHAGYGMPAGGIVTIGGLAKSEDGVTDESRGTYLGQILAYLEGQYSVTITNYSCAATNIVGDAIFVLNPVIPAYGMQQSNLEAKGYSFGYKTLVLDLHAHTRIPLPGDYFSIKIIHQAGYGTWTPFPNLLPSPVSCNCTAPLGFLRKSTTTGLPIGSFDYVNCNPKKGTSSSTTPPPVNPVVTSIVVSIVPTSVTVGSTSQATAIVKDQNGNTMTGQTVNWSIVSGGATINSSGLITTTSVSTSVIKATIGSVSGSVSLTINPVSTSGPYTSLDKNKIFVLYNINETPSQARATAYANSWGIPLSKVVGVSMGTSDNLTSLTQLNAAKTLITNSGAEWCVAVWDAPSRYNTNMSITAALTFGSLSQYDSRSGALPTSPLYNYTGSTPKTDKGITGVVLLHSKVKMSNSIQATGNSPQGIVYMHAANDQTDQPRGKSRLSQMQALDPSAGYNLTNNIAGCTGECPGNYVQGKPSMLAFHGSMYKLGDMSTNTVIPGAFGDYVTSFGGYLPATSGSTNANGQTACTYLLDLGFVGTCGTVAEPYQSGGTGSSAGWLAEQFPNIQIFSSSYYGVNGKSFAQSIWSSVKCPGRLLIIGDPLCTPKGILSETGTPPSSGSKWEGGPYTMVSNSCVNLTNTVGTINGVTKVVLYDFTPSSISYGRILGTGYQQPSLMMNPDGYIYYNDKKCTLDITGPIVANTKYTTLTINFPVGESANVICLFQTDCNQGGAQQGTLNKIQLY